jgi:hypothetical protein
LWENQGQVQFQKFEIRTTLLKGSKRGDHLGKRNLNAKDEGDFEHQAITRNDHRHSVILAQRSAEDQKN